MNQKILALLKTKLSLLIQLLKLSTMETQSTQPQTYEWNTPTIARHSVRVICDEMNLSVADKNVLTACVMVESGFNPKAIHYNKDKTGMVWSADWGICQINDFWNIGVNKEFPSTDYVLNNPEASVRFMCKMWLEKKQYLWASFSSGAYKKYL